jgi:hypothetical protein
MPKKSKRDTSIAKASLAIYPVADAFETWLAKNNTRTFFAMNIHYGEHSMVREISVVTDNDTDSPIKFRSLLRSSSTLGLTMAHWYDKDSTRTMAAGSYSRIVWMNNFALAALNLHALTTKAHQALTLHKLLVEKKLPRRPCWSRALAEMAAVKRTNTRHCKIQADGFLKYSLSPPEWEFSGITLEMLINFAENFIPTSEHLKHGMNPTGWTDTFTSDRNAQYHICLTAENTRKSTLKRL